MFFEEIFQILNYEHFESVTPIKLTICLLRNNNNNNNNNIYNNKTIIIFIGVGMK